MSHPLSKLLDRPIAFQRAFVDLTGSVQAALMLSQAYYWHLRTSDPDGWFYKSASDWTLETGLSRREQEGCRKQLRGAGFWEEKLRGVPATCHFRILETELFSSLHQTAKLDSQFAQKGESSFDKSAKHSTTETTTETTIVKPIIILNEEMNSKGLLNAKKKEANPVFVACVDIWLKETHPGWQFKAQDGKALKGIIESMRAYWKKKREATLKETPIVGLTVMDHVEPSDQQLIDFFRHFCKSLPQFYKLQTLSVLNSKFDPIIDEIKKGPGVKSNQQVSMFSPLRNR